MKKYLLFSLLFFLLVNSLFADEFTIEKINTFAFAQEFGSPECLIVDSPYLYAVTTSGLEIYEIQTNAQLQKISELPIILAYKLVKRDNYIYIGSGRRTEFDPSPLFIYQVDVSDKENPYINSTISTIEFDNSLNFILPELVGDYLIAINGRSYPDNIYTLPDLELYATIQDPQISLKQIKENICIYIVGWSCLDIYDTSDISNIQYLNTIDMSPYHQGYNPTSFKVINDTILIAAGQSAISFWNITNISQWEYIGHYEPDEYLVYNSNFGLYGNNIILLRADGLELVDISDLTNPQSVDFINNCYFYKFSIINDNENIYVSTVHDGIGIYYIANNELHFLENYFEYPYFWSSYLYSNYLFLQTVNYGVYVFDISNPYEPIEVTTCLDNAAPFRSMIGRDSLIVIYDYNDFTIKIYDITDPTNPILRNTIADITYSEWVMSIPFFDEAEPQSLYLFNVENGNLTKYDISESGIPPLLFTYNEIFQECGFFVRNGYGYALSTETYPQHLYIIGGLNDNNPTIIDTIENFSQYPGMLAMNLCGDYLCLRYRGGYGETKLYSLDDPENPQLVCTLEIPSKSRPFIYDNLLFTTTENLSFVYDLNECNGDTLEPIDYFYGLYSMCSIDCADIDDKHYLFVTEGSNVGVYEFSYTNSIDEIPEEIASPKIINFPNPFSTSTTISFSIPPHYKDDAEIEIYNLKGQRIRELKIENLKLKINKVVWDGKDAYGKQMPSGIYFAKLSLGEESAVKKMLLIR
ncbi:MAG: T9SS type A sorting domain-containing protein [Candidatus Cloacimonadia bacterium]